MAKKKRDDPMVRINVILPQSERERFDQVCRFNGSVKQSMNWRIRELIKADAEGKIALPRTPPPPKGWAAKKKGRA